MVCGELAKEEQQIRIKAAEIYPLKDVHRFFADRVSIHVPAVGIEDEKLRHIREILARHPGETAVTLCLVFPSGEKVFVNADRTFKVAATEAFVRDIEHAVGEGSVYIGVDKRPCRRSNGGRNGKPWNRSRQEG